MTAVALTLALAAPAWFVAVRQMHGMDMGVATELGSFPSFLAVWVAMMAAMMLPGAAPVVARRACTERRAAPLFAGSYLGVWVLAGLAVYVSYRPHGTVAAGAAIAAAGLYELTPFKRACRRRCREGLGSGARYGLDCVGSSIGLMSVLLALGAMSVTWMAVVAVLVAAQKLLPARASVDVPLALAIVGLGVMVVLAPGAAPGITPA